MSQQANELSEITWQQMSQQANELHQTQKMMMQMQLTLVSLMKDKGTRSASSDDGHAGDDDYHNAAV